MWKDEGLTYKALRQVAHMKKALDRKMQVERSRVEALQRQNAELEERLREEEKKAQEEDDDASSSSTSSSSDKGDAPVHRAKHTPVTGRRDSWGHHDKPRDEWGHHGKSDYEQQVEEKEKALEKKIDRQEAAIEKGDQSVDMEGLDSKHQKMLKVCCRDALICGASCGLPSSALL